MWFATAGIAASLSEGVQKGAPQEAIQVSIALGHGGL